MSFFKRSNVLVAIGFVLIALFIWIAGPYFAFAGYEPLGRVVPRLILILLVVLTWFVTRRLKAARAAQASDKLMTAVASQKDGGTAARSADARLLREKFDEAIAQLKQQRQRGQSLYDLPWYVIIGAPGSGKTTALLKSGLHFPVAQRNGGAVHGVGGTRNCDWWFTDQAVLLDTAGRYTTHDSDESADSAGWREFLALLCHHRKRRPINGVILAISAQDLMSQGREGRETHVRAARRRLEELNKELRIQLPVYLVVTKCDLVAGFTEYFADLNKDGLAQVWGVTFPYEQTLSGAAAAAYPSEFDALVTRLNERVLTRLEDERDLDRRARVFGFPQQMTALRETLCDFISEIFVSTRFDHRILLRGVYFTSGTQEGTAVDRLMGAMAPQLGLAADALNVPPGRGKAYFIERLLKDVMIAESGLAGLNRRVEMQKAAAQLGAYAGVAGVATLAIVALFWSYGRNRSYVAEVSRALARVGQVSDVPVTAPIERVLPHVDAIRDVRDVAAQHEGAVPITMRWGLYQGRSIGKTANDAYARVLDDALVPRVTRRFEQRLAEYATQPDKLYEYLKAYLMLRDPSHLDRDLLGALADLEWRAAYPTQPDTAAAIAKHFKALLENPAALSSSETDADLIARARSTVKQAKLHRLVYSRLKLDYADDSRTVRLDEGAGVGVERALRRKSGIPLSAPVPALYTAPVFQEVVTAGIDGIAKEFAEEEWVWGEGGPPPGSGSLSADVIAAYEADYIAQWDRILGDIDILPTSDPRVLGEQIGLMTSPLRGLLQMVDTHTYLAKPPEAATNPPLPLTQKANKTLERLLGKSPSAAAGPGAPLPGSLITKHFAPIHQLVAGAPGSAPIDRVLEAFGRLGQQLSSTGSQVIGGTAAGSNPGAANDVLRELKVHAARLPPAVAAVVSSVHDRSATALRAGVQTDLANRYQQEVVSACGEVVNGNYPFVAASKTEAPPGDVARLFADQGVFDTFFKAHLESLVDTSRAPWRWKTDVSGASVGGPAAMLRQFEAARRIRDIYFPPGTAPGLQFTVTPTYLDAAAVRFLLEVDGQSLEYRHGPTTAKRATWPGPNPGTAAVIFEDRSPVRPNREFIGNWALFRLIDSAEVRAESATRYHLTFQAGGHEARVAIEAQSVRNPFGSRELQQFRCEI